MDEQRYQAWWLLHRRVVTGEALSTKEQHDYEAGRTELESEEWNNLRITPAELRSTQARLPSGCPGHLRSRWCSEAGCPS